MLSCCSFCAFARWLSSSAFKALSFSAPSRNSQEESRLLGLATASRRATLTAIPWSICRAAPVRTISLLFEYDLALINADHGPKLVVQELLPAMFDVFRESDPVAQRERDLLLLEHAKLNCRAWSSGNCLSTPSFPTMTTLSPQPLRERITGQLLRGANA
jgi:hypothetical protein